MVDIKSFITQTSLSLKINNLLKSSKIVNGEQEPEEAATAGLISGDPDDLIKVYPNPTDGRFGIRFAEKGFAQIELYTLTGKLILSRDYDLKGTGVKTVDLSGYDPGIYLLKVVQNDKLINKKIVKN